MQVMKESTCLLLAPAKKAFAGGRSWQQATLSEQVRGWAVSDTFFRSPRNLGFSLRGDLGETLEGLCQS